MAYNLIIADEAHNELDRIVDYLVNNLANPSAAASLLDKVADCYDTIAENPFMYQVCENISTKDREYRKVVIKNDYIMIYRADKAADTVCVLHIIYGRRDYNFLRRENPLL